MLECLEAPMQPAADAHDDGACMQPTPAQGTAAPRPHSALVSILAHPAEKTHITRRWCAL